MSADPEPRYPRILPRAAWRWAIGPPCRRLLGRPTEPLPRPDARLLARSLRPGDPAKAWRSPLLGAPGQDIPSRFGPVSSGMPPSLPLHSHPRKSKSLFVTLTKFFRKQTAYLASPSKRARERFLPAGVLSRLKSRIANSERQIEPKGHRVCPFAFLLDCKCAGNPGTQRV